MHLRRLVAIYLWNFIQVRWETFTSRYGKFNQENVYETLSESASFCKSYDKNFFDLFFGSQFQLTLTCKTWMRFTTYGIEQSSSMGRVGSGRVGWVKKIESTSNSGVETLFSWGGKRLYYCTANLLKTICTKFYQNRSGLWKICQKHFGVFFSVHSVDRRIHRSDRITDDNGCLAAPAKKVFQKKRTK